MSDQPQNTESRPPAEHVGPIIDGTPEMEQYVAEHPEHVDPDARPEPVLDTDQHDTSDPAHAAPVEDRAPAGEPENREEPHA